MLAALVAAAACPSNVRIHRVHMPSESAHLEALYSNAKALASGLAPAHWQDARNPALDAARVFSQYLDVDLAFPPLAYEPTMEGDTVGYYSYNPATNEAYNIKILQGLGDGLEFYVVLHELLHFAGFGNIHGIADSAEVTKNWHREFQSSADPVIKTHWEVVEGKHRRLGTAASAEVMTATMTGEIFLSATTLMACTRHELTANRACIDDTDCDVHTCVQPNSRLPGRCAQHAENHRADTWSNGDTTMVVVLVVALIFVGTLLIIG
jgi:hypothetical protein